MMLEQIIRNLNQRAKEHDLYLYSTVFLAVMIMVLSILPGFGGGINSGIISHGLAYFVLSGILGLYFRAAGVRKPLLKGTLVAGVFGALIEGIQFFIPYRQFDVFDIAVNFAAAALAAIPNAVFIRRKII